MSTQVVAGVRRQLKDSAITFTDEWFEACVTWVRESNSSSQITQEFLKAEVMGQWMDADLRDLCSSCLPSNLIEAKLMTLTGRYSLQVNYAEDIGESAYNQWSKLKKLENENTNVSADVDSTEMIANWEPKARRCIYLTMTDGTQLVYGMEMVPISCLSVEMKAGTKITIVGPVDCRRGVFQLKPAHVRVIGGEVEALVEENSREKILRSRLDHTGPNQANPPAPLPRPKYKKPPVSSSKSKVKSSGSVSTQPNQNSYSSSSSKWNGNSNTFGSGAKPKPSSTELHPDLAGVDFDDDPFADDDSDFDFMDIDETLLISQATNRAEQTTQVLSQNSNFNFSQPSNSNASSQSSNMRSTKNSDTKFKPPPSPSETKFVPSASMSSKASTKFKPPPSTSSSSYLDVKPITVKPPPSSSSSSKSSLLQKRKEEPLVIDILDDDEDDEDLAFATAMLDEPKLEHSVKVPPKKMKIIPKTPYQYIKVIKENLQRLQEGQTLFIKACVATLVSNIKMDQMGWHLVVSLNDGSGFLEARMTSELLSRIIGISPADMKRMKMSADPSSKSKITNGMSNLSTRLCHINGIFGIQISSSGPSPPSPVISSFTEVEGRHIAALRERLAILV